MQSVVGRNSSILTGARVAVKLPVSHGGTSHTHTYRDTHNSFIRLLTLSLPPPISLFLSLLLIHLYRLVACGNNLKY